MSLYGPTFHVTPVDLCIIFQCNLYISCIMSCWNKIVSCCFKLFFLLIYHWSLYNSSNLTCNTVLNIMNIKNILTFFFASAINVTVDIGRILVPHNFVHNIHFVLLYLYWWRTWRSSWGTRCSLCMRVDCVHFE